MLNKYSNQVFIDNIFGVYEQLLLVNLSQELLDAKFEKNKDYYYIDNDSYQVKVYFLNRNLDRVAILYNDMEIDLLDHLGFQKTNGAYPEGNYLDMCEKYNTDEFILTDIINYQKARLHHPFKEYPIYKYFNFNIHDVIENNKSIKEVKNVRTFTGKNYNNLYEWAKNTLWFGRRIARYKTKVL